MRRVHSWKFLIVLPAVAVMAAVLGCPPAATTGPGPGPSTDTGPADSSTTEAKDVPVPKDYKKGTIKGRITYSGEAKLEDRQKEYDATVAKAQNASHCTTGDKE